MMALSVINLQESLIKKNGHDNIFQAARGCRHIINTGEGLRVVELIKMLKCLNVTVPGRLVGQKI